MSKEPELGQICFGNPTGDYGTEEFADALITFLLQEIDRVYWNVNKDLWNECVDPEIEGVTFNPYYWGDADDKESKLPNLKFSHSPQEIRWYKHPGRGQSCTIKWNEKQWREWFDGALKIIRKADTANYE